jgi:hypothetical protein
VVTLDEVERRIAQSDYHCPRCGSGVVALATKVPTAAFRLGVPITPDMSRPAVFVECVDDDDCRWAAEVLPGKGLGMRTPMELLERADQLLSQADSGITGSAPDPRRLELAVAGCTLAVAYARVARAIAVTGQMEQDASSSL